MLNFPVREHSDTALIVFMKNFREGFVKTRLAKDVGKGKALRLYKKFTDITMDVCISLNVNTFVFYSDFVSFSDNWHKAGSFQRIQEGSGLGERMINAINSVRQDYPQTIIIGTDCPAISSKELGRAIDLLNKYDYVIGPANDGGFYLFASRLFNSTVFNNIAWSTDQVLSSTIYNIVSIGASYHLLEELIDIDTFEDLQAAKFFME